jgi:hypothetical protein
VLTSRKKKLKKITRKNLQKGGSRFSKAATAPSLVTDKHRAKSEGERKKNVSSVQEVKKIARGHV